MLKSCSFGACKMFSVRINQCYACKLAACAALPGTGGGASVYSVTALLTAIILAGIAVIFG